MGAKKYFAKKVQDLTTKVLMENELGETPCADPHAGCCGERERKTPAYQIMRTILMQ